MLGFGSDPLSVLQTICQYSDRRVAETASEGVSTAATESSGEWAVDLELQKRRYVDSAAAAEMGDPPLPVEQGY